MATLYCRQTVLLKGGLVIGLWIVLRLLFLSTEANVNVEPFKDAVHQSSSIYASSTNFYPEIQLGNHFFQNKLCSNVTRPLQSNYSSTGKYWHRHSSGKEEIMVYSAYYDDRAVAGILPHIRLLTVATKVIHNHYCYIWYRELEHPYVTQVEIKSSGRGDHFNDTKYGQWLYSCKLPSSLPIPTHVSVVTRKCEEPAMIVPVYVPVRTDWVHEFGICVAIAFGKIDPVNIIEWVEMNRLFGVTEINIYNASMTDEMKKVLGIYEEIGLLRLHQMPPPVQDYSKRGSKLGSPASLNDCMLRNMYRYRFMIVSDFDEFIVPRKSSSYTDMIKEINTNISVKESYHSYTFRNAFFFLENDQDQTQPKFLRTLRYRKRSKPSGYLYAPKSFIDPRKCLSVFNHYCWIRFKNIEGKLTIDVPSDIALSHHYRSCNLKNCKDEYLSSVTDNTVLKYKHKLQDRVTEVLEKNGYLK